MRLATLLATFVIGAAVLSTPYVGAGEKKKAEKTEKADKIGGVDKGQIAKIEGELTDKDTKDPAKDSFQKVHKIKLQAGKTYRIDMIAEKANAKFDAYLVLEDADGMKLAENDDVAPPRNLNSRIVHQVKADGEYRIIATTFVPNMTGKYTLIVTEAGKADLLKSRIASLGTLPPGAQREVIGDLKTHLQEQGKKLAQEDIQLMMNAAMTLERGKNLKLAAETYREFGQMLAKGSDAKMIDMGKVLEGAGRRMELPGKEMIVKGTTLEGKEFSWSPYKGKVVLVDFWATWCGPCIAEIPNIRKAYEAYHDKGFEVVAISLDRASNNNQGREKALKFMEKEKLPWVCLFDDEPGKGNAPLAQFYGIFAIPQAILVDRDGKVVSMNARGAELDRLLEKHLGAGAKDSK